jgi:hypothetical protein
MQLTLFYDGREAATISDGRARLSVAFAAYERDHPLRRFVAGMCLYLLDVAEGLRPTAMIEEAAALYARLVLIPERELVERADWPDYRLAEYFNVPLEEIGERRRDSQLLADVS